MVAYTAFGLAAALLASSPLASATSTAEFAKRVSGSSAASAIPPNFSISATTQLDVAWQGKISTPGEQLSLSTVASQPQVGLQSLPAGTTSSSLFTLIMIDPDAPTPQSPTIAQVIHWLQPSVRAVTNSSTGALTPISLVASTPAQAPYLSPSPPAGSAAHRYIQYLYVQPSSFAVPAAFAGFGKGSNRTNFDLAAFVEASGLQTPVAANYILAARTNATAAANGTGSPQPFKGEAAGGMGVSMWGWGALLGTLFVVCGF